MEQKQRRTQSEFASELEADGKLYTYYPVNKIAKAQQLPYSLTVLLENVLRNASSDEEARLLAKRIVDAGCAGQVGEEVEFSPARVLFQDFTGVPVFVDFAVMREACEQLGGDPKKINPQIPCDLVIDHSVIADEAGCESALQQNMDLEFQRNAERYEFLKWAQESFQNVRIVPPGVGICHQLNIESFAHVVMTSDNINPQSEDTAEADGVETQLPVAYFDTLVGTDSHTPTANGIGVLGWGVGGIEAEAAALGQPITTLVPKVLGVHLTGQRQKGVTAMDVALSFAQMLREKGVVGCFVECFGEGVTSLSATMRACISNMTPEYGSTCTLFPIDEQTCEYLRLTGRSEHQIALVEAYAKAQGLWHEADSAPRNYAEVLEFKLDEVVPSLAGPSRPHDRIALTQMQGRFREICKERGLNLEQREEVSLPQGSFSIGHGALAIAAVTSCTTATDPMMMLMAGLVAKKAAAAGLHPKPWVKCILAPGSHASQLLLERAGLMEGLQELGFYTCGFGCMSCIGNSGPIFEGMHQLADRLELASVLSGNRNFEGRISPDVSQNYLTTPALVVAYSLAGTMDIDLAQEALGQAYDGTPIYLSDIWPDEEEVTSLMDRFVCEELFNTGAQGMFEGSSSWQVLSSDSGDTFAWDEDSTYVRRAPYFDGMERQCVVPAPIQQARILALLGDFITTDHISPAGSIATDSPAAEYLEERGLAPADFNTYGSRRGNHEVMMRGTFANVKLQNLLAEGRRGGWTCNFQNAQIEPLFDVSQVYARSNEEMVILAGKMYGSGSSRDWAAKGPALLGVRAVIAESFERIHRSNLIGMGILPLQFKEGENAQILGLDGSERISIDPIDFSAGLPEPKMLEVHARKADGTEKIFSVLVRVDTPTEGRYYANGGILPYVLRQLL